MRFEPLAIDGAVLVRIEPQRDARGFFARSFCVEEFAAAGLPTRAVQASVSAGISMGNFAIIDTFVIPNLHEAVFPAIAGGTKVEVLNAMGIVESFSVASLIEGADAAVKAANVELIEIRRAMALGGKAFVTLTGDVAAVQAAVDAAAQIVGQKGMLVNKVVIPSPRPELLNEML